MSRKRLNFAARVVLALVVGSTAVLIIMASLPPARSFGPYVATVGVAEPLMTTFDKPVLYIHLIHPALVTFPADWNIPDQFCIALYFEGVNGPVSLNYDDNVPQSRWDERPADAIEADYDSIRAIAGDNSVIKFDNGGLVARLTALTKYRVAWFGEQPIYLYKDKAAGGLLCYHFYYRLNDNDVVHLPLDHSIEVWARNVQIYSYPRYSIRYDPSPSPDDPPAPNVETVNVAREDVMTFLEMLSKQAPAVVQPLTQAERDRLATELAPTP